MSWFPVFLNKWYAAGAAALVIPALLILYFLKLRRREMPVSSTFLWKKAIQDLQVNSPFQRLRRNLLLLLQLILLMLLLLSFSRPVANHRPPPGKMNVILIDRSASMNARDAGSKETRLELAKREARDLIDSMPKNGTAMVIAFDDSAETLQPLTHDQAALKTAIDRIQPTDRVTRMKLGYQLADAQMNFDPEQYRPGIDPPDVYLYSDGRALDASDVTLRGKLHFEKMGSEKTANVGIVALSAKRNYERPTEVQVFARLANFGPDPVEVPVQLSVDNEVVEVNGNRAQTTFLLPDRWDRDERDKYEHGGGRAELNSVTFNLDVTNSAVLKIEQMKRDGDGLFADDIAQVVVPPPRSLSVLLVTEGNFFLEKAINQLGLKNPDVLHPDVYESLSSDKRDRYDVYIFDRYNPKVLPPSGNFIYFLNGKHGELPDDVKVKVAKNASGQTAYLEDVGILDWKRDHPILKDLDLAKLYIAEATKLDVPKDAEVLIDGLKGPLLVMNRTARGTNLIVAFDSLQSNWPLKVSFPIFLHNAMQYLAVGSDMDVRQSFSPGSTPTIPRVNLQRAGNPAVVTLNGPEGQQKVPVPVTGDFALPAMNRVGLYTTSPPIPQFEQMAVNLLDANESNLLPADHAPGDINAPIEAAGNTKARLELWWWIVAFGALPLLIIEWWVYTRRVYI